MINPLIPGEFFQRVKVFHPGVVLLLSDNDTNSVCNVKFWFAALLGELIALI